MGRFEDVREALRRQAGVEAYEEAAADNGGPEGHCPSWYRAGAAVTEAVEAFPLGTRTAVYGLAKFSNATSGDAPNEWR